ncbi:small, acid-soluble spore protein, alpha/beta type [Natronincola ferrireducens]|uniref:Small, acid-soluble spore protein, alpha/beta type n=1 Tax=Natronincola ferrireducens TaxID=393762 RepID=A0A1G9EDK7_9FIRM|nr:small, acid-soluble spore protein, alpha/beta type [Natronincola ferrireducens]SDK74250.1 Small, acid-soluble spore protein, alpha/beta type [Natronincola ferrireducens]
MTKNKPKEEFTQDLMMKYEIAEELGLIDKVKNMGWGGLTAKETGRIGGLMTVRKKQMKKSSEEQQNSL